MSKQRFKITIRDTETNKDTKIKTEKYIVSFLSDKGVPGAAYVFDKAENPISIVILGLYTFISTSVTILLGDFIRNTVMAIFQEMKDAARIVPATVIPKGIKMPRGIKMP